jgi:hypothetical protein
MKKLLTFTGIGIVLTMGAAVIFLSLMSSCSTVEAQTHDEIELDALVSAEDRIEINGNVKTINISDLKNYGNLIESYYLMGKPHMYYLVYMDDDKTKMTEVEVPRTVYEYYHHALHHEGFRR